MKFSSHTAIWESSKCHRSLLKENAHLTTFAGETMSLQWRHNERYGVSNHQPHNCLLNRLFRHRSKKTSKLRVTGLCEGNSPVTREFPAQRASNAENVPFDDVIMTKSLFQGPLLGNDLTLSSSPLIREEYTVEFWERISNFTHTE